MEKGIKDYKKAIEGMGRQINVCEKQIKDYEQKIEELKKCKYYKTCTFHESHSCFNGMLEVCSEYRQKTLEGKADNKEYALTDGLETELDVVNVRVYKAIEKLKKLKNLCNVSCKEIPNLYLYQEVADIIEILEGRK